MYCDTSVTEKGMPFKNYKTFSFNFNYKTIKQFNCSANKIKSTISTKIFFLNKNYD